MYSSVKETSEHDGFTYDMAKDVPLIDFTENGDGKNLYDNSGKNGFCM